MARTIKRGLSYLFNLGIYIDLILCYLLPLYMVFWNKFPFVYVSIIAFIFIFFSQIIILNFLIKNFLLIIFADKNKDYKLDINEIKGLLNKLKKLKRKNRFLISYFEKISRLDKRSYSNLIRKNKKIFLFETFSIILTLIIKIIFFWIIILNQIYSPKIVGMIFLFLLLLSSWILYNIDKRLKKYV